MTCLVQQSKQEAPMDVIEAIYQRRSVRAFTNERVPDEFVDDLVSAAVQAPSAMNLQPWTFAIIAGRAALQLYSERAKRHLLETMQSDSPLFQYRDQLSNPAFDIFYGAPLLIVIAATSDMPQSAEDCCLAAQNLMLAAQGMGLGTCCIGFARPWLNLATTKAELGIPPTNAPIISIVVGHPKSAAASVSRKRPEVYRVRQPAGIASFRRGAGAANQPSAAVQSQSAQPEREFEEPAAFADREDLGTDVAPSRLDAPLDPLAATRAPSPEGCSLPDEERAEAADFDATA
jgi:nitroreductase